MDNWLSARVHIFNNSTIDRMETLTENGMLSMAVVLGSSLSLVGLVFAFITYSLFSDLRSVSGTTLINLLASLFLTQLLYVVGAGGIQASDLCLSLALSLHYARLTVACWLLASSYDLYKTVKTYSGLIECPPQSLSSIFCKYSCLGWGLPVFILGGAIVTQLHNGGFGDEAAASLRAHNCWFPSPHTFLTTFAIPYWIISIINIYYICRGVVVIKWAGAFAPSRKAQEKLTRRRRLQLFLFIRIGLYIFLVISTGGISILVGSQLAWVIFSISSALQGIFVALSVTCNCQVLKLYTTSFRSSQPGVNYGTSRSDMSKSGSLQLLTWEPSPDSV